MLLKKFVFVALFASVATLCAAQMPVTLQPFWLSADTLAIDIVIGEPGDTLVVPIRSFQFVVETDSMTTFLDVSIPYTLVDAPAWSARANPRNGKVGGFSSRLTPISVGGTLIRLLFSRNACSETIRIRTLGLRFNSNSPTPLPSVPALISPKCNPQ